MSNNTSPASTPPSSPRGFTPEEENDIINKFILGLIETKNKQEDELEMKRKKRNEYMKKYREENKEKIKEQQKKYRQKKRYLKVIDGKLYSSDNKLVSVSSD